jgi:putative ABC transport system permease protein
MPRPQSRLALAEYLEFALVNLAQMKLRAFLTSAGVAVGVGALVTMIGFGLGMQKNVTESFTKLDLFNSVTVLPEGTGSLPFGGGGDPDDRPAVREGGSGTAKPVLDDAALAAFERWPGVESVFPEIRFPALVRLRNREEFRLVQAVPAKVASSKLVNLQAGRAFRDDGEDAVILSAEFLRRLGIRDSASVVGETIEIRSLAFDFAAFNPLQVGAYLAGKNLPIKTSSRSFVIAGVTATSGFGGPTPLASDVFIPSGSAARLEKLPFTNIWDLFRAGEGRLGYSAVNVRVTSPAAVDDVQRRAREMGFSTFALIDQFNQVKTSFLFMDMVLAAVGMVAIFVAALGIINTMVMSVLERYGEIGIMKAVGAANRDVRRIFFFESGTIGFLGGIGGLVLGWTASGIINRIVNYFAGRQGIPHLEYFRFPLGLVLGAVAFAVIVSLAAGIYPAHRAARVDPAVALRHE